jgi:predicted nucleic acid-binding protein
LHFPDVVWQEILGHVEENDLKFPEMLAVQHHAPPQQEIEEFTSAHNLEHLHAGERACFFLCHTLHISTLLTDDLAVRDAARQFGMTPVGSLGVLVRAFHKGCLDLSETDQYMLDLQDKSSLFVTKTVMELAIEQLRQYAN